ncbi:gamma-glutamyltransferase family protein [Sneathiella marina]|uniref:Gamma-glutamyltransferase family protein n=1 Tax=Sneathiella marina TaxID=2950108 RepID=A0ABY4VXX0_9PROT|nr:gamma-glutamyltransferase [Sneathiella marina]USG59491.1 gamma-glutamyltransferase family protein [Sneathiella marina]
MRQRFFKKDILLLHRKRKNSLANRQWRLRLLSLITAPVVFLGACGGPEVPFGSIGNVEGPLGGVAADEPRAVLVAEDILSAGGTAADAAVGLYFALSVTYPIAASLGGGGECIVYSPENNKLENLQFPNAVPAAGGDIAIPGNIRGMAALQARYGKMEWRSVLTAAEKIATFGEPLSRAQHLAMILNEDQLSLDYTLTNIFKENSGEFVAEGTRIQQIRLGSLISALRSEGGAAFYSGNWARTFVEDASNAGGKVTVADLVNYRPIWVDAQLFRIDDNMAGVSANAQGDLYAQLWAQVFGEGKNILRTRVEVPQLEVANATASVFTNLSSVSAFSSHGSTSFVTTDNLGNAVACIVSMKKPFGSGKIGNITGIVLAPIIPENQSEFLSSPLLVVNLPNKDFYYASAVSGGAAGTTASIGAAINIFGNDVTLDAAMNRPRLFTMGPAAPLLYESTMPEEDISALNSSFPILVEVDRLAVVNSIYCRNGKVEYCVSRHDPRGFGLSLIEN